MELPYSKIIEEDCLGGFMVCHYYLGDPEFTPVLTPDDFYLWRHKQVFKAMLDLQRRGIQPHEVNVKKELARTGKLAKVGGRDFIHHLIYCAYSRSRPGDNRPYDPYHTAPIVRSYKLRRDALILAQALAQAALDFTKPFQRKP